MNDVKLAENPNEVEPAMEVSRTFSYTHSDLAAVLQQAALDLAGMKIPDPADVNLYLSYETDRLGRWPGRFTLEVSV